ncbi:MAG: hypothetical protein JO144_16910 [Actinobacteria bacterium]|nr:hypothetical protein [Actinomycetota bacterium]
MTDHTRRNFLIVSGAGAAAIGVAAAVPATAAARTPDAPATLPADATDLVAHVADPHSGTLTLLVGEREVVVHDRDLVARLARAASRER